MALMPAVILICTVLLGSGDNSDSSRQQHLDDILRDQRRLSYISLFPDNDAREDWMGLLGDPNPIKDGLTFCRVIDPKTEEFLEKLRSDAEEQGLDNGTKEQMEADIAFYQTFPLCESLSTVSATTQSAPAPLGNSHDNSVRDAAPLGNGGDNSHRAPASPGKGHDDLRRFSRFPGDKVYEYRGAATLLTQEQWAAAEKSFAGFVTKGVDRVSTWMGRTATDLSQRQQRLWEGIQKRRADEGTGATLKQAGTWMQQKIQQLPTASFLSRWMAGETDEGDGTTTTKTAFIEEMKWSIAQRWSALLKQFDRGGDEEARGQKWYVKDVSLLLNDWKRKLRAMSGGEVSVWVGRDASFYVLPVVARFSMSSSPCSPFFLNALPGAGLP